MFDLTLDHLQSVEAQVQAALASREYHAVKVVGYGEVTVVLRLDAAHGTFACKRLPSFPDCDRLDRYRNTLLTYLDRLRAAGLRVASTEFWDWAGPAGEITAYCVQPAYPAERLCSRLLHTEGPAWATNFFERLLGQVERVVTPHLGLDAQASNWVDIDGELVYIDVTTPFLRDDQGRELLDVGLYLSSLPWLLRTPVRMSMSGWVFDKYYTPRGVLLDFLGNLRKERLDRLIPGFVDRANSRLDTPLTVPEVAGYYARDARTWALLQRLRRADRVWQSRVRRRAYPFLLPPVVAR